MKGSAKTYDRAYFEGWYRDPRRAVIQRDHLERRVRLAVAAAEWVLERPIESVLDVGCGEAPWRTVLSRLRPKAQYAGIDPSPYAVRRYGKWRGVMQGGVGDVGASALRAALAKRGLRPPFDLIVCADVLHYVDTAEVRRGLKGIAGWLDDGLAYVETFTGNDDTEGDSEGFIARTPESYATLFRRAGLMHLGLHCYVGRGVGRVIASLERGWISPPPKPKGK